MTVYNRVANAEAVRRYRSKPECPRLDQDRCRRQRNRERLQAYKLARGCVDCGYREHACALDFDHLPEHTKSMNVSQMVRYSWERILTEIAKCEIVCSNCHRVRTLGRYDD